MQTIKRHPLSVISVLSIFAKNSWLWPLLALSVVVLAAALRWHDLGAQSFWYDEGVAWRHVTRTLAETVEVSAYDTHVPAYFLAVNVWGKLVGESEFALRTLSALFSVLSVALTYALGRRLQGPLVGLLAALLVALNSFSIWHGQNLRMYSLLAAVAAGSMWLYVGFVQALGRSRRARWRYALGLGLVNGLGMYTHYTFGLVMVTQGLMMLLWLAAEARQRGGRALLRALLWYVGANLITIALFAPWLPFALFILSAQTNVSPEQPLGLVLRVLQGYVTFGITFEQSMGAMGVVVYFFALFGLIVLPQDERWRAWWRMLLPVVWALLTLFVYVLMAFYLHYLRFLTVPQIAVALWLAYGISVLGRLRTRERGDWRRYVPAFAAVFATLTLGLALVRGLGPLYNDPAYQRDDYRTLVADIEARLRPGDAIVLNAPGLIDVFEYYYSAEAPVYPLPRSADPSATRATTRELIADYQRVLAVYYGTDQQDPDAIVETTLNQEAYPIRDDWYDDMRLVRYATPAELGEPLTFNARFGEAITLVSAALNRTRFQPGDVIQVRLNWRTDAPLTTRYKVFVQVLDARGRLVAQRDSEPGGGQQLTPLWEPGALIADRHAVPLPEGLAPGAYTLIVGLYKLQDATARLPVGEGDYLTLATLDIHR